jgi:hypothetical protein
MSESDAFRTSTATQTMYGSGEKLMRSDATSPQAKKLLSHCKSGPLGGMLKTEDSPEQCMLAETEGFEPSIGLYNPITV